MPRIKELVEDVLTRLPQPHTEDVIHDVFLYIEQDPTRFSKYNALLNKSRKDVVNRAIGRLVKQITGRSVLSRANSSLQSTLIQRYSKLAS